MIKECSYSTQFAFVYITARIFQFDWYTKRNLTKFRTMLSILTEKNCLQLVTCEKMTFTSMYTIWHVLQYNGSCRYCDHSVTERMWVLQIIYRIEALMHICSTKVILTLFLKIVSFSNFLKTWTFKINSTSVQNHAVYQVVTNHISCSFDIFHNGEC